MKFVNSNKVPNRRPYLLLSMIIVVLLTCLQAKNLNVSNVLDRISSGDLNDKDVLEFYKKDYDASLEFHQFFQPCLSHLINEEKQRTKSFFTKLFGGMKNIFSSNYQEMEIPDLGIKIKCEVYINRFVSHEYKEKKTQETNPLKRSLDTCKKAVIKLENQNKKLLSGKIASDFNFKSTQNNIEFEEKIDFEDGLKTNTKKGKVKEIEFQDRQDNTMKHVLDSYHIENSISTHRTTNISSSQCQEELTKIKIKVTRLEKENISLEKQLADKNKIFQSKEEENCKNQEIVTKLRLEIVEKEKLLKDCRNKHLECKSDLEKCKVTGGNGGSCAECEKKLITKIDEFTSCEKSKTEYFTKYQECSSEITKVKIQMNSIEIKKKEIEKKYEELEVEKKKLISKFTHIESEFSIYTEKTTIQLAECKNQLNDKINYIEILKKKCNSRSNETPSGPGTVGFDCHEQITIINKELIQCKEQHNTYITLVEEKNKIIIQKNIEISTCEVEKNNIKTQTEKSVETCQNEKLIIEKRIKILEERYSEEKKNGEICKNELKETKIYKKKYEKCEENGKNEKRKCRENVDKCKRETIKIKTELERSERERKACEDEKKGRISIGEKCEKERILIETKIKEYSYIIEENKTKIIEERNKCSHEKDRITKDLEKRCKSQIDIYITKITNYDKEIQILKANQECPVKLTKCKNQKLIFENNLKTKEKEIITLKEEKYVCDSELRILKERFIKIKSSESVCITTLEETKKRLENCESNKVNNCPKIDDTVIINIRHQYEKCNTEYNVFKEDLGKCQDKLKEYEKVIKEYEENKNKCVSNCSSDLETCQKNIIKIQEKCNEDIKVKITEIEELKQKITRKDEKCQKRVNDAEDNVKKCNRHIKIIKTKYEECQNTLIKEIEIKKKYYLEIINIKNELSICQKNRECLAKEKHSNISISDKCEKHRQTLLKETFILKEKISKIESEKKSIYISSRNIISRLENKCQKDFYSYDGVIEEMEKRIKSLNTFKITIEGEIKNDEITIVQKQKEIPIKIEEKNIITNEINNIRSEYESIITEITIIRDRIRSARDIETIRSFTETIIVKERTLKEKYDILCNKIQKEKEISNRIIIIQEQINNINIIKNIRVQKIKENEDNVHRINKILIEIKKIVEIKKINVKNTSNKIEKFANLHVITNTIIENLEKEKENLTKNLETCKKKNKDLQSENNLISMKISKSVNTSFFSSSLLMKLFEEHSLTDNNCERIRKFKTKFYEICPADAKKKHQNTPIESKFPLTAEHLGIESQEPIHGIKVIKGEENLKSDSKSVETNNSKSKTKNTPIESKFPLTAKDLGVESQEPIDGFKGSAKQTENNSTRTKTKNTPIESKFPLKNKDLKIESQFPIAGGSNSSSVSHEIKNTNIESQFPLSNKDLKIESQHPLSLGDSNVSSTNNESQKKLNMKDIKVEYQHSITGESSNGLGLHPTKLLNVESQKPLSINGLKIESQFPIVKGGKIESQVPMTNVGNKVTNSVNSNSIGSQSSQSYESSSSMKRKKLNKNLKIEYQIAPVHQESNESVNIKSSSSENIDNKKF